MTPRQVLVALLLIPSLGVLRAESGCASGTGSQRFSFEARVGGTGPATSANHTFRNEKGWVVSLERANITLGPLYLNVIEPLSDSSASLFDFFVRNRVRVHPLAQLA